MEANVSVRQKKRRERLYACAKGLGREWPWTDSWRRRSRWSLGRKIGVSGLESGAHRGAGLGGRDAGVSAGSEEKKTPGSERAGRAAQATAAGVVAEGKIHGRGLGS